MEKSLNHHVETYLNNIETLGHNTFYIYFLLYLCYKKEYNTLDKILNITDTHDKVLKYFIGKRFLYSNTDTKITFKSALAPKIINMFKTETVIKKEVLALPEYNSTNIKDWINEWRNLFPKGVNSNGYRYRGDKQGCYVKMKKFLKEHPDIPVTDIFKATKHHIDMLSLKGSISYLKLAHYFIYKDKISTLASEIENLGNSTDLDYSFITRL